MDTGARLLKMKALALPHNTASIGMPPAPR